MGRAEDGRCNRGRCGMDVLSGDVGVESWGVLVDDGENTNLIGKADESGDFNSHGAAAMVENSGLALFIAPEL